MPIYVGARDLSGLPFGTHQFLVLVSDSLLAPRTVGWADVRAKPLGTGINGIVVGAHNRDRLVVEFFEHGDFVAAQEHFGGVETHWNKSDYDAELVPVNFAMAEPLAIMRVLSCIDAYILNQRLDPIRYPTAGFGMNSNSWVQSVVEYAGGQVEHDLKGADISNGKRIPRTYFMPYCPAKPRQKVN